MLNPFFVFNTFITDMYVIILQYPSNEPHRFQYRHFGAVWIKIWRNNEKFIVYLKIIIFNVFCFPRDCENARTSTNSSCNNDYQSNSTSMEPLLVGIIVLASTVFIIILMTLYANRLKMRQQSIIEQRENVWTQKIFISIAHMHVFICFALYFNFAEN